MKLFVSAAQSTAMSKVSNVIPFRKRPPSQNQLEAYRRMTRNWSPELRQMMFPDLVKFDAPGPSDARRR